MPQNNIERLLVHWVGKMGGRMNANNYKQKKIYQKEKIVIERNRPLIDKIKKIPFIEIDINLDLKKLREEVDKNDVWYPHLLEEKKNLPEWYYHRHAESFRGQCVIDLVKDSKYGMIDPPCQLHKDPQASFDEEGRLRFFSTNLGEQMPYSVASLKRVSSYVNRTRLINSKPQAEILWHSHHNNIYKSSELRLAIFNLPIYTNTKAIHSVRDFSGRNNKIYSQHFKEGKLYLFNSWHDHMFKNGGETNRIAFCPYYSFADQSLLDFLKPYVEEYNGPLIE